MGKWEKRPLDADFGDVFGVTGCTAAAMFSGYGREYLELLHGREVSFSKVLPSHVILKVSL